MWYVGPIAILAIYALTNVRDKRRDAEVERWRTEVWPSREGEVVSASDYRGKPKVKPAPKGPAAKAIAAIPAALHRMVDLAGGGQRIGFFELVPKLAYLAAMGADAMNGSEHQTVTAKLEEAAPNFTVRPLPFVEGVRAQNTGVLFKKDPEFMAEFLVEPFLEDSAPSKGDVAKDIRKWLSPPIRAALLELPLVWLRVEGKAMGLTMYGRVDAEKIQALVAAADVIFAEHGAGGGPSLLGDDSEVSESEAPAPKAASADEEPAPKPEKAKKPAPKKKA